MVEVAHGAVQTADVDFGVVVVVVVLTAVVVEPLLLR